MEVFVARHPIFDRDKDVYGYELAFRSGFEEYYHALEADKSSVDLMAFVNFGELTDGKKGLVSFPQHLLMLEFPILFPSETMTAVISGTLQGEQDVIDRCRDLKKYGYSVAIDDFAADQLEGPLLEFADIARVDFAQTGVDARGSICKKLTARGIQALAQSVGTIAEFDQAASWGYAYFEGDFFSKPSPRASKKITASKLNYLRLLREVNRSELSYDDIAGIIEKDVALTYRLLRFMNSAWFGLRFEVRSVRHALVLLGPREIRRWLALVAVRKAGEDKPYELMLRSLTRAKVAEQIGGLVDLEKEAPELFLMGMFSVIDALTDRPMTEVLGELPLKEEVNQALLGQPCTFRSVYETVLAYEKGQWDQLSQAAAAIQLNEMAVPELFRNSLKWANQALEEV